MYTLHKSIIKLTPLHPVLVVSPGWCRHAAVGVKQDPEAPNQQEDQEEQQKADEGQGSSLLSVYHHQVQGGTADATARATRQGGAGWVLQQLIIKCGYIVHPPRGPKTGFTHWLKGWCVGWRSGESRKGVHEVGWSCKEVYENCNLSVHMHFSALQSTLLLYTLEVVTKMGNGAHLFWVWCSLRQLFSLFIRVCPISSHFHS